MNETTVGREPVEVIEIITPKCVNVHGSAPCTATQTGDAKCFNTRATCNDVDNYQARPASHLTPTEILNQGDTGDRTLYDGTADFFASFDVSFPASPDGVVFDYTDATRGLYVCVTAGELIFRAGSVTPSAAGGTNTGRIAVAAAQFAGKSLTLYCLMDFTASGSTTIRLWAFDPIDLTLTLLGSDTYTAATTTWEAGVDPVVGASAGDTPTGEATVDFNGRITSARLYDSQSDPGLDVSPDAYRMRYFFDDGRKAKPSDDIYILPLLIGADTVGTRLNLTGSDDRYEPLGRRAFMSVNFADAPHSDHTVDPYRSDREYDPLKRATFWRKWLARNKFGRTRALVRRYTGYKGDALSAMQRQTYVVDRFSEAMESVTMSCRDVLSLTEFRRAQVPAPSPGKLDLALTDVATSLFLSGDRTASYPATGTLRIGDELMTYSAISYDAIDDQTDVTGLTRGTDGSTAQAHDIDSGVQLCRRYTDARVAQILEDLIVSDAQVPAQLVDLPKIQTEDDENLSAYVLSTVISEPTGVDQLVGELARDCSFYIWWNERRQIVDMQAIKPLSVVDKTFTQERDIIADSLKIEERPKERLTTISMYFQPRDFAADLEKPVNYEQQLVVSNAATSGLDLYGTLPQTRQIFSRWLGSEAQANQTGSRLSIRFADVPEYVTFRVDAKDRATWVGDFAKIEHDYLVDARGARLTDRRFLVIEAEEVMAGHSQRLVCVDVTLDGLIYLITANGIGTYTAELFSAANAFITDNNGLNPDGTPGATIG
jgi:hypothetical protein